MFQMLKAMAIVQMGLIACSAAFVVLLVVYLAKRHTSKTTNQ